MYNPYWFYFMHDFVSIRSYYPAANMQYYPINIPVILQSINPPGYQIRQTYSLQYKKDIDKVLLQIKRSLEEFLIYRRFCTWIFLKIQHAV